MAMSEKVRNFRKAINRNITEEKGIRKIDTESRISDAYEHIGKNEINQISSEELKEELEM